MIAIYCRQSVDKKDSISIEQQEKTCKRMIEDDAYKVYSDKGFTGANTNRPAFEKLMNDVRLGRIKKIVCYKVDRISRSLQDFVGIYSTFEEYGVDFVSCSEQFDTSTAMGKATLQIIMVFAELERNMIQKRVKDNFYERAKKGLFLAGVAPYGFEKKPVTIDGIKTSMLEADEMHPEKMQAVCFMYNDYRLYKSIGRIAKILNERGLRTNRGKPFTSVSVSRILRNTVYVRADADVYNYLKTKGAILNQPIDDYTGVYGCTVYGTRKGKTKKKFTDLSGEYVQLDSHEGIISSADWLAVQYELDRNKPVSNSGKGKNTWLSGLTKCKFCGKGISVVNGQYSGRRYLNCGGKKEHICKGRSRAMTFDEIEQAAENSLMTFFKEHNFSIAERPLSTKKDDNKLKIQLTKNREEIENLMKRTANASDVLIEYIDQRIRQLDSENKKILDDLRQQKRQTDIQFNAESLKKRLLDWKHLDFDIKKTLAHAFIEKIIVGDGQIEVFFR